MLNAVFIRIPKTGGVTIEEALKLKRYPSEGIITTDNYAGKNNK